MLPVDAVLPDLLAALDDHNAVLLQAPPGAGKTTRVPPALLEAAWRDGRRILMLEPRRLAARSAARFMAKVMNESPGKTIGYRTRLDTKVSGETRIEVVTEGILTRLIQADPALSDYAAVLFDEFHERSLQADLGLALVRESQQALRDDLRVVVMSATLDTEPLARLLDGAPVISAEGRQHPVDIEYRRSSRDSRMEDHAAATVCDVLNTQPGSALLFLPGVGEIRRVFERLEGRVPEDVVLAPLYGHLSGPDQDAAIAPAPDGRRKVVLATAIAESSLTIEGIRVVVDAGLQRRSVFDPGGGMSRLITQRVSKSSADQRAGRAGRMEPGLCIRLWAESERLNPFTPAEITEADLAGLVLELACWGARDSGDLAWLDPPPAAHWNQATDLLCWLDAVDDNGVATEHGRHMRELGLHPRLAHMVLRGREWGHGRLAAELAALLSERDLLGRDHGTDIEKRLRALRGEGKTRVPKGRLETVRKLARSIHNKCDDGDTRPEAAGRLLALAYPDRIAQRRKGGPPRYRLSNGRGALLDSADDLAQQAWLITAELDGQAREARIFLAARTDRDTLENDLAAHITESEPADWDDRRGAVVARRVRRLGELVLDETPLPGPGPEQVTTGLLAAVRRKGLSNLPWTETSRQYVARVRLLHQQWPDQWPMLDDEALLEELEDWLGPFLAGVGSWNQLQKVDLMQVLRARVGHEKQRLLDELAPPALEVPAGREVRLDYTAEQGPVLAVKLQAVFGWTDTPRIARRRVPVVLHLLSPARRPLAVTSDLASFWRNGYPDVRKDMRGRYPKHNWPEWPASRSGGLENPADST